MTLNVKTDGNNKTETDFKRLCSCGYYLATDATNIIHQIYFVYRY